MPQCRWSWSRVLLMFLLFASPGTSAAEDEFRPHPACFEPFTKSAKKDELPGSLNLEACSEQHANLPVSQFLGLTRYQRPPGTAGNLRGTLAYERITGRNDTVMYRLVDNAGGTGTFSLLLVGREIQTENGRELQDIVTRGLGDRCHLGTAWAGSDPNEDVLVGISLTPATLTHVLAAPGNDMPHPERDQQRVHFAFGERYQQVLANCPTCCVGEAIYELANDGDCWQLVEITLDALDPFDQTETGTLYNLLSQSAETTPEGLVIPSEAIASIQRKLVTTHSDPGFSAFIDQLKQVVRHRDHKALIPMTTPDIMLGFGGSGGHDDLQTWLENPQIEPDLWKQLDEILSLGAIREGPDAYCLPYTSCLPTRILAGQDLFGTVIVTAANADLHTTPANNAAIARQLDYDILTLSGDQPELTDYYQVQDHNGNQGFVLRDKVTFVIGPRLSIIRDGEGWKIDSFVSGD